ncbi:hypothetical protein STANM309S_00522 [Streptomyces tanashiensis]
MSSATTAASGSAGASGSVSVCSSGSEFGRVRVGGDGRLRLRRGRVVFDDDRFRLGRRGGGLGLRLLRGVRLRLGRGRVVGDGRLRLRRGGGLGLRLRLRGVRLRLGRRGGGLGLLLRRDKATASSGSAVRAFGMCGLSKDAATRSSAARRAAASGVTRASGVSGVDVSGVSRVWAGREVAGDSSRSRPNTLRSMLRIPMGEPFRMSGGAV